jgi:hypothetical protein
LLTRYDISTINRDHQTNTMIIKITDTNPVIFSVDGLQVGTAGMRTPWCIYFIDRVYASIIGNNVDGNTVGVRSRRGDGTGCSQAE